MTEPAQALPYAAAPASTPPAQLLPMLGGFALFLGALRLAAVALLVAWPLVFRDAPTVRTYPARSYTPTPFRGVGWAAETAGAALLVAGGVACVRRHRAARPVVMWAAAFLVVGVAWGATGQLIFHMRVSPAMQWPLALLGVGQAAAWEAAFPALLWALCRRAR